MPEALQSVVVVEDDESLRRAIERLLRVAGYAPLAFASAEAYLTTPVAQPATCLISDVHLPGISGFELQACLEARGTRMPVVFITAFDTERAREEARRAGALRFLVKPFTGRSLIEAVKSAQA
jgi:FixJ family two-component response regulator